MNEREITAVLGEAVRCLDKNDMASFRRLMHAANEGIAALENGSHLRGEWMLIAALGVPNGMKEMAESIFRAEELMDPAPRILVPELRDLVRDYNAYRLWCGKAGREMETAAQGNEYRQMFEILQRRFGVGGGILNCFQAQLAYYRGEFEKALSLAKEIQAGSDYEKNQPSLSKIHALEIMFGVARHTMDQKLWRSSSAFLRNVAAGVRPASRACVEQAAVLCAVQDMALGNMQDVPVWLRIGDLGAMPVEWGYAMVGDNLLAGSLPYAMYAHMQYLAFNGEPLRALHAGAVLTDVYGVRIPVIDAYVHMLQAGCYYQLEKPGHARYALAQAMENIAPDGLWLIAAEFSNVYGDDLNAVAREFDPDAPEKIRRIGEDYMNRLAPLRNELMRGSSEGLTKREQEIASLVMKGYSNSEIATELNVTVRTVRFHLENVYSKLNITGRSKLVNSIDQGNGPKLAIWVK